MQESSNGFFLLFVFSIVNALLRCLSSCSSKLFRSIWSALTNPSLPFSISFPQFLCRFWDSVLDLGVWYLLLSSFVERNQLNKKQKKMEEEEEHVSTWNCLKTRCITDPLLSLFSFISFHLLSSVFFLIDFHFYKKGNFINSITSIYFSKKARFCYISKHNKYYVNILNASRLRTHTIYHPKF